MRHRWTFAGDVVTEGLRWACSVVGQVFWLTTLVALTIGVTAGGILLHRPAWFLGVIGGVLVFVVLGDGAYRGWRDAESRAREEHAEAKDQDASQVISDTHRSELQEIAVNLLMGVRELPQPPRRVRGSRSRARPRPCAPYAGSSSSSDFGSK